MPSVINTYGGTHGAPVGTWTVLTGFSVSAGDAIVVFSSSTTSPTTSSSGWTKGGEEKALSGPYLSLWYFIAGSDGTTSFSINNIGAASLLMYHIAGADMIAANGGTGSGQADPPSLGTGSSADKLWLAAMAMENATASAPPANFTDLLTRSSTGVGRPCVSTARRAVNSASLNPGTFTNTAGQWAAWTVAAWASVNHYSMPASVGSSVSDYPAVNLRVDRRMAAQPIEGVATGQDVGFSYDGGTGYTMSAPRIQGVATAPTTTLRAGFRMAAEGGSASGAFGDASFTRAFGIRAETGSATGRFGEATMYTLIPWSFADDDNPSGWTFEPDIHR